MSDKTDKIALDSASVPIMQRTNESMAALSANIPRMQLAPSKQTPPPQTTQSTGGDKSNKEKEK